MIKIKVKSEFNNQFLKSNYILVLKHFSFLSICFNFMTNLMYKEKAKSHAYIGIRKQKQKVKLWPFYGKNEA